MKFTKSSVKHIKLPPGKSELAIFDDDLPGFGLRIRASGVARWIVQYRLTDRQRRMTIGPFPAMPVDKARSTALDILARVRLGEDPQGDRQAKAPTPPSKKTVGDLIDAYLDEAQKRQRPTTFRDTKRYLTRGWSSLHAAFPEDVEMEHVADGIRAIARSSGDIAANRARAALSAMFAWSMGEGLAKSNPTVGTNRAAPEKKRDRILTHAEIKALWQATEDGGDMSAIVRLLLLTGQRRNEIAAMEWGELDLAAERWDIPATRTKNGKPHVVPLSSQAIEILSALHQREGKKCVFGSGAGPFSGFSKAKLALDRKAGIDPWRLHDLRRTFVTGLSDIGEKPHIVEALVNHVSGFKSGVAGVYNRAEYLAEKVVAMQRWDRFVSEMVHA